MKTIIIAAALLLAASAWLAPAHAELWGYVDEKGVAHFATGSSVRPDTCPALSTTTCSTCADSFSSGGCCPPRKSAPATPRVPSSDLQDAHQTGDDP